MAPGDDDQDQLDMQKALQTSLQAQDDKSQIFGGKNQDAKEPDPQVLTCQNRVSIEDRIKDLTMRAAIEVPRINDLQGDTWVYIDAPQRQPEQNEFDYERYVKRYKDPMLLKKETLTKYSPGLAKLFGPTQQYRFLRRRKLVNKLPSNVKYVIDLTPPSEGEDAVFLTTELCCSMGIRLWHQSSQIWNVSGTLVKGEEEFSSVSPKAVRTLVLESPDPLDNRLKASQSKGTSSQPTPSTSLPLEYSPIRHRSAIERVLSALQGTDPVLDSATKVWTTFAVAKNFEITHSPLEDYIIRWLRAYPNSYFVEVLPEASHQIAEGLQNFDLARDSFAILVGEEALDSLRQTREPQVHKCTTFGRKKEELPEQIHTRIEYASKSFLERINHDFAKFVSNEMQWIDGLPEMQRLSAHTEPELQVTIEELRNLLKGYVRGAINKVLYTDFDSVPGPDLPNKRELELLPRVDRTTVWANLPLDERILTRTYWEALISFKILQGSSNLDIQGGWKIDGGLNRLSYIEKRQPDQNLYREIKKSELQEILRNGQIYLDQAYVRQRNLYKAQQNSDGNPLPGQLRTLPDRTINRPQDQKPPQDLFSASSSDFDRYDALLESDIKRLPERPRVLRDDSVDQPENMAMKNEASSLAPAQPIDIPKPTKRTADFPDALSPLDKRFEFEFRTEWSFGAPRDDPVAQVQKNVNDLHLSPRSPDAWTATDNSLFQLTRPTSEESETGVDPWRGYSDRLHDANNFLQHLVPRKDWNLQNTDSQGEDPFTDRKPWLIDSREEAQQKLLPKTALNEKKVPNEPQFFNLERFFGQAQNYIDAFAGRKLRCSSRGSPTDILELGIVNTLVCLEDSEWKYLPLWAGGNDDGSMGVYNDDLPTAEHGFTTAGPEVHDGLTPVNSVKAPSEFDFVSAGDSQSTFNTSTATNRGFSDAIRRDRVYAVDSMDGSTSDGFTTVTPSVDSDDEETFARKQIEAQERIEEAEEVNRRIVKADRRMMNEDESYADLFDGEEEEEEDDDGNDTDRAEVSIDDEKDADDEEDLVIV